MLRRHTVAALFALSALIGRPESLPAETLVVTVVDKDTGQPIPCRMHLRNAAQRPRQVRGLPFWKDHFCFDGTVELKLSKGNYTFEIERGPEYIDMRGHFRIDNFSNDTKKIELKRIVDMKKEGWWSGDLHVRRDVDDVELLMEAEDLHVAPVLTWWNKKNLWSGKQRPENLLVRFDGDRFYQQMAGEDDRGGGAVLLLGLEEPLEMDDAAREYPSSLAYLSQAKQRGAWVDVEKPFDWDVPLWLASGKVDSISLANHHLQRTKMHNSEAGGKPRDVNVYKPPLGNALWSQDIYYHALNCGLKIPPSAGSASGLMDNPVGYNRVYVHVDGELTWDKWWDNFRRGQVVVTNGPLLRPFVNGQVPGHEFLVSGDQQELELEIALNLATRDKISYLEVIQNGRVIQATRLADWVNKQGHLPTVKFQESGWIIIRAVADSVEETYRFASTGPYYVSFDGQPRISRRSAQFFLDWCNERIENIKLTDPQQRDEVMQDHLQARKFWEEMVEKANAP